MPSGEDFTHREIAGSVAPISSVGGSRQIAAAMPRSTRPKIPVVPIAL
jgi:hypothetical protein